MTGARLTLQNRIATLMVIFSFIFIGVFTLIQLNSQLANINRYNAYQANLSSIIARNTFEAISSQIEQKGGEYSAYIQNAVSKLTEANIINDAVIFDKNGNIVAADKKELVGDSARYRDLGKMHELSLGASKGKLFLPEIDNLNHRLYMYMVFGSSEQNSEGYCAKIGFSLGNIQEAFVAVYKPVILTAAIIVLLNIILAYFLSKAVVGPVRMLNEVTKIIAGGNLSIRTRINTRDELQELGETFNEMTEELVKMKERAENANPLTKLPGNIVIQEEINKCLEARKKFLVVYCDLDNFKAFNDKYGIAQGDEAIKLTARIFKEAVAKTGNKEDFVGHEGGDDFIILTTPDKGQAMTEYITGEFDKEIRSLYSKDDLERGGIVAHGRDGTVKNFPIMTISLAGVTNGHREISSYGEVTNIAAEVKKKAKSIGKSVFVLDKRKGEPSGVGPEGRQGVA